jgi:GNAT superfamily N-acetyltransferase
MTIRPLTPARWKDLEALFGARGACGGCWCMYWRRPRSTFEREKGEGNRRAFKKLVAAGEPPGLLAYDGGQPVGWCAIAPRSQYPKLARSRILQPVDDQPVWSVSCLFVARPYRRRGVSVRLLEAVADYARRRGGRIVEGYPVEAQGKVADAFVWTGLASAFHQAGFTEVARRSKTRPIMRRGLR